MNNICSIIKNITKKVSKTNFCEIKIVESKQNFKLLKNINKNDNQVIIIYEISSYQTKSLR